MKDYEPEDSLNNDVNDLKLNTKKSKCYIQIYAFKNPLGKIKHNSGDVYFNLYRRHLSRERQMVP